ncbi:MAG TPA: hypothetical protein VG674_11100 [Amycolatopsis sp.]|uniref:Uncharacterized protein n=1 Tax=Amycolatopsis nalaikhensis TaxID=715472 RepID=A0ABY8XEC3_9PSEU|nr:hypothetical protein [Amycolatopsis sp. 2-2]WIV53957.1 hypothetical protein QP939_34505 [Amycolatopsis sp. 2-2]HWD02987.1 hypothetical protein [Amycolatopsis sp.]
MTITEKTRRPSLRARRTGYLVSALINAALLIAVNGWPGWAAVPFLTAETRLVVGVVDLSLVAGLVTSLVYVWSDPEWLRALGGAVTTCAGLVATVRIWQVFPFDFAGSSFDWPLTVRVLLAVGIAGAVIGLLVQLVTLARSALRRH